MLTSLFRSLHQSRCYYVRLSLANLAVSVSRDKLLSLGTCLGKFTKSGKFRLHITVWTRDILGWDGTNSYVIQALPILAEHARYKVWVKANGFVYSPLDMEAGILTNVFYREMPFLYGGHVVKAHVGRWSEDCPEHQGVVVYSMNDTPLGFGVTARSTQEARRLDPTGITCFRQADCGEYLRDEDSLFATS